MKRTTETRSSKRHSTKKIHDEFTGLDISAQRKYQLRRKRDGLCTICGKPVFPGTLMCLEHHKKRGIRRPGFYRNR